MSEEVPGLVAARNSWRCVEAGDKEGWLALMADDVCMEDPIGQAPTNPSGEGVKGKAAVGEFYDKNMGPAKIEVETEESFPSSSPFEAAHILTLHTTLPNGVKTHVRGVFTYRVNDEGLLTSLRGYWHMGIMEFEQPS